MIEETDPVTLRRIRRAVRKLPRPQREIFLALRLDDLSYEEIAERTGLTAGQVEREFAKSLANFARRLDREPRRWWRLCPRRWPIW